MPLGEAHVTRQEVSGPLVGADPVDRHASEASGRADSRSVLVAAGDPQQEERGPGVGRHELGAARRGGDRPEAEDGDGTPAALLHEGRSHALEPLELQGRGDAEHGLGAPRGTLGRSGHAGSGPGAAPQGSARGLPRGPSPSADSPSTSPIRGRWILEEREGSTSRSQGPACGGPAHRSLPLSLAGAVGTISPWRAARWTGRDPAERLATPRADDPAALEVLEGTFGIPGTRPPAGADRRGARGARRAADDADGGGQVPLLSAPRRAPRGADPVVSSLIALMKDQVDALSAAAWPPT